MTKKRCDWQRKHQRSVSWWWHTTAERVAAVTRTHHHGEMQSIVTECGGPGVDRMEERGWESPHSCTILRPFRPWLRQANLKVLMDFVSTLSRRTGHQFALKVAACVHWRLLPAGLPPCSIFLLTVSPNWNYNNILPQSDMYSVIQIFKKHLHVVGDAKEHLHWGSQRLMPQGNLGGIWKIHDSSVAPIQRPVMKESWWWRLI